MVAKIDSISLKSEFYFRNNKLDLSEFILCYLSYFSQKIIFLIKFFDLKGPIDYNLIFSLFFVQVFRQKKTIESFSIFWFILHHLSDAANQLCRFLTGFDRSANISIRLSLSLSLSFSLSPPHTHTHWVFVATREVVGPKVDRPNNIPYFTA